MADSFVPSSEAELDQLIENTTVEKKGSTGGYIFLTLVFPPFTTVLAFILAAKKNVLHLVLPGTTIIYSIFSLLIGFGNVANISNQSPYARFETIAPLPAVSVLGKILTYLCIIAGFAGIFTGLKFRSKAYKEFTLSSTTQAALIGLIILQTLLATWLLSIMVNSYFASVAPVINGYQNF